MQTSRRVFGLGLAALGLSACAPRGYGTLTTRAAAPAPAGLPPDLLPAPNAGYDRWVAAFRDRAAARGIRPDTLEAAFRGAGFLPGVVTRDRNQPETRRSLEDYLSVAVSDERVALGRAAYAQHGATLRAIGDRTGVDPHVVTAIWGVESHYGTRRGDIPVISATSTLAFDGRRGVFFEAELLNALRILQAGDVAPSRMTGSWAGAMGHTQFMPSSFLEYAVDFTGDGRRDIWAEDPSDALASTAAYLQRAGWTRGIGWGAEVTGGAPQGTVIQPQEGGPRFAVTGNFRAIKRYNNSDLYALAVGHLADRIGGAGPLRGSFPPDGNGLTKADRVRIQERLTAAGFDTRGTDGVIGRNTESAIRGWQASRGLPVTGTPSRALLQALG